MAHLEFAENYLKKEFGAIRCGKGGRTLVGGSFQWEGWLVFEAKYKKDKAVASKVDLSGSNTWVFLFLFVFLFFFFFVFTFCKVALSGSNSESFSLTPH